MYIGFIGRQNMVFLVVKKRLQKSLHKAILHDK